MKEFGKVTFFGVMLFSSHMSVADPGLRNDVSVTEASSVRQQISKLSPPERKRFEEAIKMGNTFIPHHFDGSAYDNGDAGGQKELKRWQQNIRPLVDRDVGQWYTFSEIQSEAVEQLKMDGLPEYPTAGSVTVCPQIVLVSIAVPDEHFDAPWKRSSNTINFVEDSFELIYRTKVIGAWPGLGPAQLTFIRDKRDQWVSVLIGSNKNNKVSRVMSEYALSAAVPKRWVDIVSRYISGVWSASSSADDKIRLKQMLQKLKDAEDRVCKSLNS